MPTVTTGSTTAADNIRCWNKWSQCPVRLPLPKNDKQLRQLLAMLRHLGSDNGLALSRTFDYIYVNPYQYRRCWERYDPAAKPKRVRVDGGYHRPRGRR